MFEKIVSGGQTGANRAALDFAIKHKIPHGGWVPKGRYAEDGSLPAKYMVQEMPTTSYEKWTEQNVIDSDGTLIFSHGSLAGGSAYTHEMTDKHRKSCLHLDLSKYDVFTSALSINDWIHESKVATLNIAGPRGSEDPKIYKDVIYILESALLMDSHWGKLLVLPGLIPPIKNWTFKRPETADEAVDQLISGMKLKELVKLARMPKDDLISLHGTIGMWIRNSFVYPRNDKLLESCRELSKDKVLHHVQVHTIIIQELWKKLQETHRLKVVK